VTLYFSDIDGTLLDRSRRVSARTAAAVRAVTAAGRRFVLCSSRMPGSMRLVQAAWSSAPAPLIAYNGGLVIDASGEVVLDVPIAALDAMTVYDSCTALGVHGSFYTGDDWFAWADDRFTAREVENTGVTPDARPSSHYIASGLVAERPPHKIMAMGEPSAIDDLERAVDALPGVVGYRSKPSYLELGSADASKGAGVQAVARAAGVPLGDCVFFGDNDNDLPAFAVVGTAVAVANAKDAVLAAATVVTSTNHDDGVARYIESSLARRP
jgi:Cof subfamily protein (haloacid dehalogenase superfamily)